MTPGEFDALCTRLTRRARRLGLGASDADDFVQETLMRLLQTLSDHPLEAPDRYALVTLRNLVRARWRRYVPMEELREDSASVPPDADARLCVAGLLEAIEHLPADQARILRLVLAGESSPARMAAKLDLPVGTVMSRLARARARLRSEIGLAPGAPIEELF